MEEVRRRIFVAERRSDTRRPDHFYKNYLSDRLSGVGQVHDLSEAVLSALSLRFVERSGGRVHVRGTAFEDWRELLPMISPLAVVVHFLVEEARGPALGSDPRPYLEQEIGDSALIFPRQPEIQHIVENDGLNELHMHLNGSTELDIIWSDAVRSPEIYLRELEAAVSKSSDQTGEFYDQLELGLTPYDLYRRLRSARRVRHLAASIIGEITQTGSTLVDPTSIIAAMNIDCRDSACPAVVGLPLSYRPIARLFPGNNYSPIVDEAAFLYLWLQAMRQPGSPRYQLGLALYFNLLSLTQIARISVQQIDEVGFDQFQKYTLVGVREHLERAYEARFRQLNGASPHLTLKHLEGRLAPKKDIGTFLDLIGGVVDGYLRFRGCPLRAATKGLRGEAPGCMTGQCAIDCPGPASGRPDAELALVVHFIKVRSLRTGTRVPQACDMELRVNLRHQAQIVRQAVERHRIVRQLLRGIDAASNELHAPPEAFAPAFRYLRRHGVESATYHVGEDFIHLVSGIRACAEAKRFLPLGPGDRMGHATALGISPALWLQRTGPRLMIQVGEHLDNLVYAHARLAARPETAIIAKGLELQIALYSTQVYGREQSPAILNAAWELRGIDVLEVLELEREDVYSLNSYGITAAAEAKAIRLSAPARRDELSLVAAASKNHPLAYELFRERHRISDRLERLVEVEARWLPESAFTALQADVLRDLANVGVAIETLPTSNVRISAYDRLDEHHLFRWLGLADEGFSVVPAICVGSDDTGIFATSLRNEYAAIFDVLRRGLSLGADDALAIVEKLNRNGSAYRFRPIASGSSTLSRGYSHT